MNATKTFTDDEIRKIEAAIAAAESRTSAEIVCAVATESGRYDRAESIVGLLTSIVALGTAHLLHEFLTSGPDGWSVAGLGFAWQTVAVVLGFIAGNCLASYFRPVRHLFVSAREIEAGVQQAAWHVFGTAAIRGTVRQTGLLIYVSLCERRVVILPDHRVANAMGADRIAALRDEAVDDLRSTSLTTACIAIIEAAGKDLAGPLPSTTTGDEDELSNRVLLFHPRPGTPD